MRLFTKEWVVKVLSHRKVKRAKVLLHQGSEVIVCNLRLHVMKPKWDDVPGDKAQRVHKHLDWRLEFKSQLCCLVQNKKRSHITGVICDDCFSKLSKTWLSEKKSHHVIAMRASVWYVLKPSVVISKWL